MRTFCLGFVALLTVTFVTGTALAHPPGEDPGHPDRGHPDGHAPDRPSLRFRPPSLRLMEVLDENKDGVLSSNEIENSGVALRKLDKNKDGKLSQAEIGRPRFGRGRFGGFDGPGRGLRRPGRGFGRPGGGFRGQGRGLGGQGDGFRGPRGRPRPGSDSIGAPPARPDLRRINVESLLAQFDKNKDVKLQKDELPGFLRKRFSPADADGDGAITKQEFEKLNRPAKKNEGRQKSPNATRPNPSAESDANPSGDDRTNRRASRRFRRGPNLQGAPQIGEALPNVTCFDEDGKGFNLADLKGSYSVIVFGCLT